jgi:subfamily B ATP-binding cassette protein MsbA
VKEGSIEFKNVSFKYPSRSTQVIDQMNFEIPATSKIALVGASGCGKSTITNLLLRFYDVENGNILIDGVDIKDYNI